MIDKLKYFINKLLRRESSVDSIVAPFNKAHSRLQSKLETHRQAQLDRAQKDHERAAKIEAKAQAEEAEADRAKAAVERVASFIV